MRGCFPPARLCLVTCCALATAAAADGPIFEDATASSGLIFRHRASKTPRKYLPETMSGGVAILDFDQDGWMDVFFVNGAKLRFPHPEGLEPDKSDPRFWNRLFRNKRDGTFEDVTEKARLQGRGYGMGVAVGDYDNDGYPDLAVTNFATGDSPAALLYHNDRGKRFVDVTEQSGLEARGWATSAGFLDYDNDGKLDLFLCRYMKWSFDVDRGCGLETTYGRTYCHPDLFEPESNYLFRNKGDGTFEDVGEKAGVGAVRGKALGVAFNDFNNDGWTDVAVANDSHPQFLFRNNGDGTFEEVGLFAGVAYDENGAEFAGMGVEFADLDDDGLADIVTTALSQQKYAVFYNTGDETFEYSTGESELGKITQKLGGWGIGVFDYDNDGLKDVFLANSHVMDNIEHSQPHIRYLQPPLLLRHEGRRFKDVSSQAGPLFQRAWASRGAALGDLDNDGDVDIVVSNLDGQAYFARNRTSDKGGANWIGLRLRGVRSNRDGLGAQVKLRVSDGAVRHLSATRSGSYLSSRDPRVFAGLGSAAAVEQVEIHWPSGIEQVLTDVGVNRVSTVAESGR